MNWANVYWYDRSERELKFIASFYAEAGIYERLGQTLIEFGDQVNIFYQARVRSLLAELGDSEKCHRKTRFWDYEYAWFPKPEGAAGKILYRARVSLSDYQQLGIEPIEPAELELSGPWRALESVEPLGEADTENLLSQIARA